MFLTSYLTTSGAADTGAILGFGIYDGVNNRDAAIIKGLKENGTSGNYAAYLSFSTRPDGGSVTERMRITSGGLVGINTSAPKTNLQISNVSGADLLSFGISDYQAWVGAKIDLQAISAFGADMTFYTHPANSSNNATVVERMRITSAGYTKMSNTGTYQNVSDNYHELRNTANSQYNTIISTVAADPYGIYILYPSVTPNTTTNSFITCGDSTATRFYISSDGYVHSRSTSIVIISSDENLKKDITDYDKGLSEVLAMKPRYYRYKTEPEKIQIGFIAQEMDEALKGSMIDSNEKNEETGENYKTYQVEWYPLLVKAIQEQNQLITSLQEQITELKQIVATK